MIENISVDKTSGKLPLTITAKVEARDREQDEMTYVWHFGNGETKETTTPHITYTYDNVGDYILSATVLDNKEASAKSQVINVVAGNSRPEVSIDINGGNSLFFEPGRPMNYKVTVTDPDGSAIDEDNIFVSIDYLEGMDEASLSLGHQEVSAVVTGKALTMALDCKTCHKEKEKSVGPMYRDIAEKYKNYKKGLSYLQSKIISGGSGVWGEVTMPAHPNLTKDESRQIGLYIQSLASTADKKKSLPATGSIVPNPTKGATVMVITASYTDNGENNVKPLTGSKSVVLQLDANADNAGAK